MTSYPTFNPYCVGWTNPTGYYPDLSNNVFNPVQNKEKEANDPFPLLRQFQKIQDVRESCFNFQVEITPSFIKAIHIKPPKDKAAQKELEESPSAFLKACSPKTDLKMPAKAPLDKSPQKDLEEDFQSLREEIENVLSLEDIHLESELKKDLLTISDPEEMSRYNPLVFCTMQRILNAACSLQNQEVEKEYELKQEELRIHDLITEKEWEEEEREADKVSRISAIREKEPLIEIKEEAGSFSNIMKVNKELSLEEAMAERRKSFEYEEDEGFESNEFWD